MAKYTATSTFCQQKGISTSRKETWKYRTYSEASGGSGANRPACKDVWLGEVPCSSVGGDSKLTGF
jgi:hypothetical protein